MNTRLQVEHPVTEMITGIDLVEWQLRVANDEPLPLSQTEISSCGHAIEVRLYAEDTDNDFLPQTGKINQCLWPTSSKAVRIDTGIEAQNEVSIYYDPMIAKLITHSSSREKAIQLMLSALANTRLTGIKHNRTFLISTLQSKAFQANQINTRFLEDNPPEKPPFDAYPLLAASIYPLLDKSDNTSPWGKKSCWQMNLPPQTQTKLLIEDEQFVLSIKKADESRFQISLNQKDYAVRAQCSNNKLTLEIEGKKHAFYVFDNGVQTDVVSHTTQYRIMRPTHTLSGSETPKGQLSAPMPGNIVAILCHEKDSVTKGQTLMIIEAMKMEHSINAPHDATIKDIFFKIGSQVNEGDELLSLEDRT
jgi:3-methylcrotonyl-CoA carboxylase alpha subunit